MMKKSIKYLKKYLIKNGLGILTPTPLLVALPLKKLSSCVSSLAVCFWSYEEGIEVSHTLYLCGYYVILF